MVKLQDNAASQQNKPGQLLKLILAVSAESWIPLKQNRKGIQLSFCPISWHSRMFQYDLFISVLIYVLLIYQIKLGKSKEIWYNRNMENELKTNAVKLELDEQYQIRKSIIRLS